LSLAASHLIMYSIRSVLKKLSSDYGIENGMAVNSIRSAWAHLMGEAVAAHTYPFLAKNGILTISVDSPQWMHHLSFYKEEITAKLGRYGIKDVRFRVGKIPPSGEKPPISVTPELSDEELRYIDNTLRGLKDDDLRQKFRKLIIHGLTKGRKKPE